MLLLLALLPANALCLFLLFARWRVFEVLINLVVNRFRWITGWHYSGIGANVASDFLLNVLFLVETGYMSLARMATTAFLVVSAVALTAICPWVAICVVLLCVLVDACAVLLSPAPSGSFTWRHDRHGIEVGLQPTQLRKHIVITGGVSLAAYSAGVLHAVFERYGAEAFEDFGFVGASSGSWLAACMVFAANGGADVRRIFELVFITACQTTEVFPFGLVFVGCHAVEELCAWTMRIAEKEWPSAHRAIAQEGKLATWLTGCSLRRLGSAGGPLLRRCIYRMVVRRGADVESAARVGGLISASSVFPYFTHPSLCSRLACAPAVLDGYFPGKGSSFLPVPDMALPAEGAALLIDMSGGMEELYAGEERVQVVSVRSWREFAFQDWAASSPAAFQRLFDWGHEDARSHGEELERKLAAAFGLKPLGNGAPSAGSVWGA